MKKILLVLILLLLTGCASNISQPIENQNPQDLTQDIDGDGWLSLNDTGVIVSQTSLTTISFPETASGLQIDNQIINTPNNMLMPWMQQPEIASGMVQRTISMCTIATSIPDVQFTGKYDGLSLINSESGAIITDQDGFKIEISTGHLNTKLFLKNNSNQIINFSGGLGGCQSIIPYGYARINIVRNYPVELNMDIHRSGSQNGLKISTFMGDTYDTDRYNEKDSSSFQATPQGRTGFMSVSTTLTSSDNTGMIVSGFVATIDKPSIQKIFQNTSSGLYIDTRGLTGVLQITVEDKWGIKYNFTTNTQTGTRLDPAPNPSYPCGSSPYTRYFNKRGVDSMDFPKIGSFLNQTYGTGKVIVSDGGCGGNFTIDYYLQSGESIPFIDLYDIYGQVTRQNIPFVMSGKIHDSVRSLGILGNGINVVVTQDWSNMIKISSQNMDNIILSFQSCSFKPQAIKNEVNGYDNLLQDYIFDCSSNKTRVSVKPKNYTYRTTYDQNIQIPTQLQSAQIIKVSSDNYTGNQVQYFIQSTVGIFSKQTKDKTYTWLYNLINGNTVTTGSVELYTFDMNSSLLPKSGTGAWLKGQSFGVNNNQPIVIDNQKLGAMNLLLYRDGAQQAFVSLGANPDATSYYTNNGRVDLQSSISLSDVAESLPTRGDSSSFRIYGYSDRGLYQPGDDLYIAGWVRNNNDVTNLSGLDTLGPIDVSLRKAEDWSTIPIQISGLKVDRFGGFNGQLVLPQSIALGDYYVQFNLGTVGYSQSIKVQEYQKPTFFSTLGVTESNGWIRGFASPEYYFGGVLKKRDLLFDYAISSSENNVWWRWRNDQEYYYDAVLSQSNTFSTGGIIDKKSITATGFTKNLIKVSDLPIGGATVKLQTTIRDLLSDEVHIQSEYQDYKNQYSIGLKGQVHERYYNDTIKKLNGIGGIISGSKSPDKIEYTWSYFDWADQTTYQGIDGSVYYNGKSYNHIGSGSVNGKSFIIPTKKLTKPGSYLLQVKGYDSTGNVVAWIEKELYYAAGEGYNRGAMPNNYTLSVDIPKQEYQSGDMIDINISPYIKGSSILLTVEQSSKILDTYQFILTGQQIKIPAKRGYFPTSIISITQIVPTKIQSKLSTQPSFYQGYSKVMIDSSEFTLNLAITTDKKQYRPGEQATVTIKTTDSEGNPIDARLSIGIVDKALNDLYAVYKNPLGDFFVSVGSSIVNYTNMKRIYQSLRVFAKPGSKGGGGGAKNILGALRESFEDVAFWRGGVYTKNGAYVFTTKLPDNLTTWTIDVVGISQDARVGTVSTDITASKDFIIQANLPGYMIVPDNLFVPVKALGLKPHAGNTQRVTYSGLLLSQSGTILTRFVGESDIDSNINLDIDTAKVDRFDSYVQLILEGKRGSYKDGFKQKIMLQNSGLIGRKSYYEQAKKGSIPLGIPAINSGSDYHISVGLLPVTTIDNLFQYAIDYPYGCTEQILSKLTMLSLGKQYAELGFLTGYYDGDTVKTNNGSNFSYKSAITDSVVKVMKNQSSDGGFSYWEGGNSDYSLSIYVYSVFMEHQDWISGFTSQFQLLQHYLDTNGGSKNELQYLFYLHHRARNQGGVNSSIVKQITKKYTTNLYANVLGASILSSIGDLQGSKNLLDKISPNDFIQDSITWELYPLLTSKSAAEIYYSLLQKDKKYEKLSEQLIARIIQLRQDNGLWGQSTVDNLAIGKMMYIYFKATLKDKNATCILMIDGKKQSFGLHDYTGSTMNMVIKNIANLNDIQRDCTLPVIVDTTSRFVYPNQDSIPIEKNNVEFLERKSSYSGSKVGDIVQLLARFKIDQDAKHVAVELYIPSDFKPIELISKKQNSLTYSGNCYPTHYEIRFDRLFLYYDSLKADTICSVQLPVLKAYEGNTQSLPSKIFQMYSGGPFATTISKVK